MATVKRVTLQWAATHPIYLGYCQENNVRVIEIDVSPIEEEYPGCVYEVFVQRPGEKTGYTADTTAESGIITWTLTSFDTYIAGDGKIMVRAKQGHAVKKTVTMTTITGEALDAQINSSAPSESVPGWLDQALSAAGDARDSAKAAQTEADKATVSAAGAKTDADRAEAAANIATGAATEAVGVKTSVEATAEEVKTAAENVTVNANEAQASATAAQTAEANAKSYSEAAATSATNAQGSATDAKETLAEVEKKLADGELKGEKGDPGKDGKDGVDGKDGKDGKDAEVTAESVEAALGYAPVEDVQVAGTSVLVDGVAEVPVAQTWISGNTHTGVVAPSIAHGLYATSDGKLQIYPAESPNISSRSLSRPIVPTNLDYAVKSAMCDGKGAAWTAAEQQAARSRMGLDKGFKLIETITLTEELGVIERDTEPDGTAYNFKRLTILLTGMNTAGKNTFFEVVSASLNQKRVCVGQVSGTQSTYNTLFEIERDGILIIGHGSISPGFSIQQAIMSNTLLVTAQDFWPSGNVENIIIRTQSDGALLAVGTTIRIYGVRA